MQQSTKWIGVCLALAAALSYSFSPIFTKFGAEHGLGVLAAISTRGVMLLILLSGYHLLLARAPQRPKKGWMVLLIVGATSVGVSIGYIGAVEYIDVGLAVTIFYSSVLMILLLSPLVDGEQITRGRLGAACLALVGIGIAVGLGSDTPDWRGVALAAFGAISVTIMFFASARAVKDIDAQSAIFWAHIMVVPALVGLFWYAGGLSHSGMDMLAWAALGVLSLGYSFGILFHVNALRFAPPAVLGIVFSVEPVITIILAYIVLGEQLNFAQYAGSALVLSAVVMASILELRSEHHSAGVNRKNGLVGAEEDGG